MGSHKMPYRLSKSKILAGLQCPKRLYLEVHQPELVEESQATDQVQRWGAQIHEVARSLYQGGILIGHDYDLNEALTQTQEILNRTKSSPLFEATFETDGVLIRSDIFFPGPVNPRLIEVKAATEIQDNHLEDCTIQAWVIQNAGIPLTQIELAHINTSFVYKGDHNYDGLFFHEDVTGPVRKLLNLVSDWVREFRRVLEGPVPVTDIGFHCKDPYDCPFLNYCSGVQPEYPVSILPYGRKIIEGLLSEGIFDVRDIPAGPVS